MGDPRYKSTFLDTKSGVPSNLPLYLSSHFSFTIFFSKPETFIGWASTLKLCDMQKLLKLSEPCLFISKVEM